MTLLVTIEVMAFAPLPAADVVADADTVRVLSDEDVAEEEEVVVSEDDEVLSVADVDADVVVDDDDFLVLVLLEDVD